MLSARAHALSWRSADRPTNGNLIYFANGRRADLAPPDMIYSLTDGLLPRRDGRPLDRLDYDE